MAYECATCDKTFGTSQLLESHCKVKRHSMNECHLCNRIFKDECALDQHYRSSSAHSFCQQCDRVFPNEDALKHHLRNSPAHAFCKQCDRTFSDDRALKLHLRNSPAHSFCHQCSKPFPDEGILQQRLRASSAHSPCHKYNIAFQDSVAPKPVKCIAARIRRFLTGQKYLRTSAATPSPNPSLEYSGSFRDKFVSKQREQISSDHANSCIVQ